jgi:hypothetical protein
MSSRMATASARFIEPVIAAGSSETGSAVGAEHATSAHS